VTIAPRRFHRRLPTMCTSAARNALAVRTIGADVEVVLPVLDGDVEVVPARSRSATIASIVQ
jgi:hypothetical protein